MMSWAGARPTNRSSPLPTPCRSGCIDSTAQVHHRLRTEDAAADTSTSAPVLVNSSTAVQPNMGHSGRTDAGATAAVQIK